MNAILKKLNYKAQEEIFVLNAPGSFQEEIKEIGASVTVKQKLPLKGARSFVLAFFTRQKDLESQVPKIVNMLEEDGVLWIAYPKKTSKKYACDFNRDSGWALLAALGFEPVRMIAIDEDWSALRFKKAGQIKTMTRSSALSKEGKARLSKK